MAVYVEGLREMVRSMEQAGVEIDDLKEVMADVATEAATTMQRFVPSRTGALRGSVRGNKAKNVSRVTIGKARVPYAGPINYGWARRGIKGANFVEKTDKAMDDKVPQMLEKGWERIVERYGL